MVRSFFRSFARQPEYHLANISASTLAFQTTKTSLYHIFIAVCKNCLLEVEHHAELSHQQVYPRSAVRVLICTIPRKNLCLILKPAMI